jgi:hypothetical protein
MTLREYLRMAGPWLMCVRFSGTRRRRISSFAYGKVVHIWSTFHREMRATSAKQRQTET